MIGYFDRSRIFIICLYTNIKITRENERFIEISQLNMKVRD
jgi:hypothetical protein